MYMVLRTKKLFQDYLFKSAHPNFKTLCTLHFHNNQLIIPDLALIMDNITVNKKECRKTLLFSTSPIV